jgi:hypothetical protein
MRMSALAIVAVLGTLQGTPADADEARPREPTITWLEDRYTETWSWVLEDATIDIGGVPWQLVVRAGVRDHGRPPEKPAFNVTLTTPASKVGYGPCRGLALIVEGVALQDIDSEWSYGVDHGQPTKSTSFAVSPERFRRIAGAKRVEARLCNDEFVLDPTLLATLRAFAVKVRSGPPPAAERKRD